MFTLNIQMHYPYIIDSELMDKYHVGESPDVINRLKQHNSHYFFGAFTKAVNEKQKGHSKTHSEP